MKVRMNMAVSNSEEIAEPQFGQKLHLDSHQVSKIQDSCFASIFKLTGNQTPRLGGGCR